MGLVRLQLSFNRFSRVFMVFWESLAGKSLYPARASVAMTPMPAALETMAMFDPLGRFCLARNSTQSNRASKSSTLRIPALLKAASYTWSSETGLSDPDRPDFRAIMGFIRDTARAALMKFLMPESCSTYMTMLSTSFNEPRKSIMSAKQTSGMEPRLTKWENPIFSWRAISRTAVQTAPLWDKNAIFPFRGIRCMKLAFRQRWVLTIPTLSGPMILKPVLREISLIVWAVLIP